MMAQRRRRCAIINQTQCLWCWQYRNAVIRDRDTMLFTSSGPLRRPSTISGHLSCGATGIKDMMKAGYCVLCAPCVQAHYKICHCQ